MSNLFSRLEKLATKDLSLRESHVKDETIKDIEQTDYEPAKLVIQAHNADRAGPHYDVRLIIGRSNKAISFASKYGLPETVGEPKLFIQQPEHEADYATFEGKIPKGQYGAGDVKVVVNVPGIIKSYGNKLDLTITKGPMKGRYTILKQKGKNWIAIRHKKPDYFWEKRPGFKTGTEDMLDSLEFIAEHKLDGCNVMSKFDSKKGVTITARSKSVMGELSTKEDHVPWIRDFKVPTKYDGVVVRAELVHPTLPFKTTGSIILSDPHTAVEAQKKVGKLLLMPFELVRGPKGSDVSKLTYGEKHDFLRDFVNEIGHELIKLPAHEHANKRAFHEAIITAGGEGTVLKHLVTGEAYKLKKHQEFDLKIVGFEPGEGKYSGTGVGAFKIADKHGTLVGNVGTGLTDKLRQDAFNNPQNYMHKLIKVRAHEVTEAGQLRMPAFVGFTTDKTEADILTPKKKFGALLKGIYGTE